MQCLLVENYRTHSLSQRFVLNLPLVSSLSSIQKVIIIITKRHFYSALSRVTPCSKAVDNINEYYQSCHRMKEAIFSRSVQQQRIPNHVTGSIAVYRVSQKNVPNFGVTYLRQYVNKSLQIWLTYSSICFA